MSPVVIQQVKTKPLVAEKKVAKKPRKMTEVVEECVVDKATGREFCQVVSSTPVSVDKNSITTPESTPEKKEKPSLFSEAKEECMVESSTGREICQTTVTTTSTDSNTSPEIKESTKKAQTKNSARQNTSDDVEIVFWNSIKDSNNVDDFKAYLAKYPNGQFEALANNRLKFIGGTQSMFEKTMVTEQNTATLLVQAKELVNQNRYSEALPIFKLLAEQGLANAQFDLGLMYQYGKGVAKDDAQAIHWYRKAAAQGDGDAKINLKDLGYTQ
jgi:hypothetical protein